MHISQVSNLDAVSKISAGPVPAQKNTGPSEPTDTVQLSPAAQAHLAGQDADHDGDGH